MCKMLTNPLQGLSLRGKRGADVLAGSPAFTQARTENSLRLPWGHFNGNPLSIMATSNMLRAVLED